MIKNKMNKTFIGQTISALFAVVFLNSIAQAAPAGLTYQGRLVKNNLPVEANPVTLTVKVTSPGVNECILYEETHTLNMTNSDGIFSVKIGSGTRTVNDEALSMVQVFSNTGTVMPGLICGGGATTYTSVSADSRNIYATFNDGVDTVAFSSPYVIQSVPYALEAERLAGKSASEFLQTTADTTQSKINALTAATPYAELLALIGGTSTQYMTSSSAISTSGNITQTGTGTVTTGTGAVALNGPTTIGANQNFSMASGTGTFAQTYTGTGTASSLTANSVTTSAAQSITGNGLTSGSLLSLSSNSTAAANGNKGLDIAISGANGSASITRTGVSSVVTSTGATSTNVGGYFSASGATNNYGLIVANGNVGVGTTTPGAKLEVASAGGAHLVLQRTTAYTGNQFIDFRNSSAAEVGYIGFGSGGNENFTISNAQNADLTFYTNGTENMRIKSGGNVGIGTAAPARKLEVTGATGDQYIRLNAPSSQYGILEFTQGGVNTNDFTILRETGGKVYFQQNAGTVNTMTFGTTGNVGIGTSTPANLLHLNSSGNTTLNIESSGLSPYPQIKFTDAVTAPGDTLSIIAADTRRTSGDFGSALHGLIYKSGRSGFSNHSFLDSSNNVQLLISNSGNVGIGTTSPVTSLQVGATTDTSAKAARVTTGAGADANPVISLFRSGNVEWALGTGGSTTFHIAANPTASSYTDANMVAAAKLSVTTTGNVGIGTTGPSYKLDVAGDINTSTCFRLSSGTTVGGTCTSDERLKEDVQDYTAGLSDLLKIKLHTYKFNGLGEMPKTHEDAVGVIAQEVEKTNPELVKTRMVLMYPDDKEKTEIKVVDYSKFSYMLINAVKELYAKWLGHDEQIEQLKLEAALSRSLASELKSETDQLKSENAEMKARLERLERALNSK